MCGTHGVKHSPKHYDCSTFIFYLTVLFLSVDCHVALLLCLFTLHSSSSGVSFNFFHTNAFPVIHQNLCTEDVLRLTVALECLPLCINN